MLSEALATSLPSLIASRRGARARQRVIVRSHDHGGVVAVREPRQQIDHVGTGGGVEVAGGLVGEDHPWPDDERSGDRDALLLPAGEVRREMGGAIGEADLLEQVEGTLTQLRRAYSYRGEPGLHVLERGQRRNQVELLEDEAERVEAELGQLAVTESAEVASLEGDAAGAGGRARRAAAAGSSCRIRSGLRARRTGRLDLQVDASTPR